MTFAIKVIGEVAAWKISTLGPDEKETVLPNWTEIEQTFKYFIKSTKRDIRSGGRSSLKSTSIAELKELNVRSSFQF